MTIPSYSTAANIKALMPDTAWGTSYDSLFGILIAQASRVVDGALRREPGAFAVAAETTRYFDGNDEEKLYIGELAAVPRVVSIATSGIVDNANNTGGTYTSLSVVDYWPWPTNWASERRPILRLDLDCLNGAYSSWYGYPKCVKVTGYFGFAMSSNIPDEIIQAVNITVVRSFKRGQQSFQDAGAIAELSQLRYVKKLDPDVVAILEQGRFSWVP